VTYRFSLLRFVPDPARGEFINIGAIAGDDSGVDWSLRLVSNLARANRLDDKGTLGAALAFAATIEARIEALDQLPGFGEPISLQWLETTSAEMQNIVQLSEPTPVVATSAEDALDLVFEELIVDPAARRFRFFKKYRAVSQLRAAYTEVEIPDEAVDKSVRVTTSRYSDSFDFGIHNGRLVQLAKCWSFQLPGQDALAEEVKAWAWVVEHLKELGGEASIDGRLYEIAGDGDLDVAVVYVPPVGLEPRLAFDQAQAAFADLGVTAVPGEDASRVAAEAAGRLGIRPISHQ